jgi:hypothetical protein
LERARQLFEEHGVVFQPALFVPARMRPRGYGAAGVRWPPRFNHSPPWRNDQYAGIEYAGLPVVTKSPDYVTATGAVDTRR